MFIAGWPRNRTGTGTAGTVSRNRNRNRNRRSAATEKKKKKEKPNQNIGPTHATLTSELPLQHEGAKLPFTLAMAKTETMEPAQGQQNFSTIKFALSKFYCRGVSHKKKTAFWTIFLSAPKPPPPSKAKFWFLLSSRRLWETMVLVFGFGFPFSAGFQGKSGFSFGQKWFKFLSSAFASEVGLGYFCLLWLQHEIEKNTPQNQRNTPRIWSYIFFWEFQGVRHPKGYFCEFHFFVCRGVFWTFGPS